MMNHITAPGGGIVGFQCRKDLLQRYRITIQQFGVGTDLKSLIEATMSIDFCDAFDLPQSWGNVPFQNCAQFHWRMILAAYFKLQNLS